MCTKTNVRQLHTLAKEVKLKVKQLQIYQPYMIQPMEFLTSDKT